MKPNSIGALASPASAVAALLVVMVLLTGACGGGAQTGGGRFSDEIGCDPQVDDVMTAWAERGVAAVVVDIGGDRPCVGAYGPADPETGRANTTDTVFSIGSITKPVTAAAVFDLIDDGILTLDDPAGRHVPGLDGGAADATIRQLLLHTSGLTGEHGVDHVPLDRDGAVRSISGLDVSFQPGSAYQYANANYTLLALIIEAVTEQGYRQYLVDEILLDRDGRPLGGFWDGDPAPDGPRAWGHFAGGSELSPQRGQAPGPHWAMDGNGLIAMTPLEMAEWTYALFTERILSPDVTDLLRSTSTLLAGEKELPGWTELERSTFGEPVFVTSGGGGSILHQMTVGWFPESSRVLVLAENGGDHDVAFFSGDVLFPLIVGTGIPTPPLVPEADPGALEAAVGTYRVGDEGMVEVTERDGGLLISPVGVEAMELFHPVPESKRGLVRKHESQAIDFVEGRTTEGLRERQRLEAEYGPLRSVDVAGTIFDGETVSYLSLEFADHDTVLAIALNGNGGTEAFGYDSWPAEWMVSDGAGGFVPPRPDPAAPLIRVERFDRGLEVSVGDDQPRLASAVR